jgi:hypothetical protein
VSIYGRGPGIGRELEIRSPDQRGVAEFHELLGGDDFRAFLSDLTEALETGSEPSAFWARWVDVVIG